MTTTALKQSDVDTFALPTVEELELEQRNAPPSGFSLFALPREEGAVPGPPPKRPVPCPRCTEMLTPETFHEHLRTVHPPLKLPFHLAREGILDRSEAVAFYVATNQADGGMEAMWKTILSWTAARKYARFPKAKPKSGTTTPQQGQTGDGLLPAARVYFMVEWLFTRDDLTNLPRHLEQQDRCPVFLVFIVAVDDRRKWTQEKAWKEIAERGMVRGVKKAPLPKVASEIRFMYYDGFYDDTARFYERNREAIDALAETVAQFSRKVERETDLERARLTQIAKASMEQNKTEAK